MTLPKISVETKVSIGNIIEIVVILTLGIMAFSNVKSDVETVKGKQHETQLELRHYKDHVSDTYVRKDVLEQILIRLEAIDRKIE
jgi:hypothetical protein